MLGIMYELVKRWRLSVCLIYWLRLTSKQSFRSLI